MLCRPNEFRLHSVLDPYMELIMMTNTLGEEPKNNVGMILLILTPYGMTCV